MVDKCFKCIFAGELNDIDGVFPLCTRETDFIEASNARRDKEECPWHITKKDIIRRQDNGLL